MCRPTMFKGQKCLYLFQLATLERGWEACCNRDGWDTMNCTSGDSPIWCCTQMYTWKVAEVVVWGMQKRELGREVQTLIVCFRKLKNCWMQTLRSHCRKGGSGHCWTIQQALCLKQAEAFTPSRKTSKYSDLPDRHTCGQDLLSVKWQQHWAAVLAHT